ncbi:MAG: SusC/RagA family TonB-linked outer membrane protein, partial [Chitinophagaceae bacterium]|nr:SusC/RagA family TonB-linked outer membrane protein [Chitinophagaceae bacterium]
MVLFCALLLTCIQGIAQDAGNITVSGKVSISSGGELAGTTVQVKGDKKGVSTDAEGHFKISAPKNAILVFSRIGSKSVEIKLNGQSTVNVTLEPADNSLDQVVVVSYGKQKARNITGSIGKINGAELTDIPAAEFAQRLNGKTTGLQINQVTGRPGQAMTFRIRGAATMSGSNSPLFVVDGQVIAGDINTINPDDIESISVLKDAAAAALYGSRSSNGVILITTRQAKAGRTSMSFSTYYGWQSVPRRGRPDLMNAREFASFMKGYYEDKIKYENWKDGSGQAVVPADYADPSKYGEGTDWYDALLRTAPMNNYTFNISTGTEKVATSITATYFNQEGVMLNTGMERFSFRANTEFKPVDGLRIGFNISPTYQVDKNTTGNTDGNRQILGLGIISSPIVNPYNADGSFVAKSGSFGMYTMANPLQQLNILEQSQKTFRTLGNLYVDLEIAKGLHIKPSLSVDIAAQDVNYFRGSKYGGFGVAPPNSNITAGNTSYNYNSWLTENLITYELK